MSLLKGVAKVCLAIILMPFAWLYEKIIKPLVEDLVMIIFG